MEEQNYQNLPEPDPKLIKEPPKSKRPLGLTMVAIWFGLSLVLMVRGVERKYGSDWSHLVWSTDNAFEIISTLVLGSIVVFAFIGVLSRERWGWFAVQNSVILTIISTLLVLMPIFMQVKLDTEAHQIYRFPKILISKVIVLLVITFYMFRSNVVTYFRVDQIKRPFLALSVLAIIVTWTLVTGILIVFKVAG